jgi:hypothetical protein
MNDKDPPPFGYTFTNDVFGESAPVTYDHGQSILSDMESQHLRNFFSSTNPFDLPDSQPFPAALDTKASAHDYNNWEDFIGPATVHRVTTTIPDQAQLQHGFQDQHYAPSLHTNFPGSTQDDLQAARALFNQAQPSYTTGRSHSFHGLSAASIHFAPNGSSSQNSLPMGAAPHGLMDDQFGALIPNQSRQNTMDAQFAAQWPTSNAPQQQQADFGPPLPKLDPKRSYAFGTDDSFNSATGYLANGHENENHSARRSTHDVQDSQHLLRTVAGIDGPIASPTAYVHLPPARTAGPDDDHQSDEASSDEEHDDPPAKKRKKSAYRVVKDTPKKGTRSVKTRKASTVEEGNKKKRAATAAQKTQRENLTEEQKRSNHILSEQKRRDLIKQGYKDLNEIVPAVRGGGLSKSQVLIEAANFLEKLIEDNETYRDAVG